VLASYITLSLLVSKTTFQVQCFVALALGHLIHELSTAFLIPLSVSLLIHWYFSSDLLLPFQAFIVLCCYWKKRQSLDNKEEQMNTEEFVHEETWRDLFNQLPQGVAIQDHATGEWLFCNRAMCKLLNATDEESVYSKLEEMTSKLLGSFTEDASKKHIEEVLDSPSSEFFEDPITRKLFDVSYKVIKVKGKQTCLYSLKDATEKSKIEYLRVANLIKAKILKSLSHELRNPINCILNSLEYCKEKLEGDDEACTNLNIALANTNILLNKYNDILDFLKIEMGKLELDCVNFDIRKLIEELNNCLSIQVAFRGIHYSYDIDRRIPQEINSDPNRILQVILNLTENAIKYNRPGGTIKLVLKSMPEINSDAIEVSVSDTGQGIDSSKLASIFSLEQIGDEGHNSKRVSVSLPVAYHICEQLGGELRVVTKSNQGTIFSFQVIPKVTLHSNAAMKEQAEWDLEEELYEDPTIHHLPIPREIKRISIEETKSTKESLLNNSKGRKKSGNNVSVSALVKKRWLNNLITDDDAENLSLKGLRLYGDSRRECKDRMRTPKRSFSAEDHKDKKSTHVNILKQKVAKLNSIREMLHQTVKRDPDTIRSNIIRNKNEFFISKISKYFSQSQTKNSKYKYEQNAKVSNHIRNVRLNLLKYHIQNEVPKSDIVYPCIF
jgi:signal transduction histidine kinase